MKPETLIWGSFAKEDIGKVIIVSGRAGPRWFYRPVLKVQKALVSRLPVNIQIALLSGWVGYLPVKVRDVIEKILFEPSANNGVYVIEEVDGCEASVERRLR